MNAHDATIEGIRFRVWDMAGNNDQLAIIALHGFTGTGRDFAPMAHHLGRRIIAPDLIGHGHSDAPSELEPYQMPQVVEGLSALIDQVYPTKQFILLGYSMGGRTALHLAPHLIDRVAALVLIGAHPGLDNHQARLERQALDFGLADQIEEKGIDWFQPFWAQKPIIATQQRIVADVRQKMASYRAENRAAGLAQSLRGMGLGTMPSAWPLLDKLHIPCGVIVGQEDDKFIHISEQLMKKLPQGNRWIIPSAGHCAHLERPEDTALRLSRFLAALDGISRPDNV